MKKLFFLMVFLVALFSGCDTSTDSPINYFGWSESTPAAQGMNAQLLDSLSLLAENSGFIDGLLVVKNSKIIKESYFNGFTPAHDHNIKSVSKSFLSAIAGIAIQQGYLTLEDNVMDYFPEYDYETIDPRKHDITVKHLLTMHMGIEGETYVAGGIYNRIYNTNDWLKTTIEFPLVSAPGEKMRYNTFTTHLLSGVIQKAVGRSILDYARENLFNPMGISIGEWENQNGYYFGGNSMHFALRELGVFGLMYMNEGRLNSTQIIPQSWVTESTSHFTNWPGSIQWGAFHNYNYGYLWWMGKIDNDECVMALGYAGQFVLIFKELDLIFVSLSNDEVYSDTAERQELFVMNLVSQYVLPAVNR